MAKEIKIKDLELGASFAYGTDWVKIAEGENGIFAISADTICQKAFDESNSNNWNNSTLRKWLNKEIFHTISFSTSSEQFNPITQDLTADDGTNKYEPPEDYISLLTADQYRKWRKYIPQLESWWWLITPRSCNASGAHNVRSVYAGGALYGNIAFSANVGVRPICNLKPDTLVIIKDSKSSDKEMNTERFTGEIQTALGNFDDVKLENSASGKSAISYDGIITETIYRHVESGTRYQITITRLEDADDDE